MPPTLARTQKPCTHCGKKKAIHLFSPQPGHADRHQSWCRRCSNLGVGLYRTTDAYREARAEYRARPEVQEKRRAYDRARRERKAEYNKSYARTYMGKLAKCRSNARYRLKAATSEATRAHYRGIIAMCDREVARLKGEHELPKEPPKRRKGAKP